THLAHQACLRGNESLLALLSRWPTLKARLSETPATGEPCEQLRFGRFNDPTEEARAIASWIADTRQQTGAEYGDFALLLRSARYKAVLLEALTEHGIPVESDGLSERQLQACHALYDGLRL